jgi:hypothetical protein
MALVWGQRKECLKKQTDLAHVRGMMSFFERKLALFEHTHADFPHRTEGLAPTRSQILRIR